jgi:hypothetical protein
LTNCLFVACLRHAGFEHDQTNSGIILEELEGEMLLDAGVTWTSSRPAIVSSPCAMTIARP